MKLSSAVTMTTVLSILSVTHGAPIISAKEAPDSAPAHGHYRRASSVSELAGRDFSTAGHMDGLNYNSEGASNHIKNLFNLIKRQLGSSASTSTGTTSGAGPDPYPSGTGESRPGNPGDAARGLMGGGMSSPADAGFAFEPENRIQKM